MNATDGAPAVDTRARASVTPRLEVRSLSKTFAGVTVLDQAHVAVAPGEIHALVGQNGSGKSTLIKLISGVYRADHGGEILVDGARIGPPVTAGALHHQGLAFVHQAHGWPALALVHEVDLGLCVLDDAHLGRARLHHRGDGPLVQRLDLGARRRLGHRRGRR